jgi:hypothetical protein
MTFGSTAPGGLPQPLLINPLFLLWQSRLLGELLDPGSERCHTACRE